MVVPANYDPSEATVFAADVDGRMAFTSKYFGKDAATAVGLSAMTAAFWPGHKEDLQRGERWGVPNGETSPAFRDAASWNLGYVTQQVGLPQTDAIEGAGALNRGEYSLEDIWHWIGGGKPTQKRDGPMGMSLTDYRAFLQGLNDARAAGYSGSMTDFYRQYRDKILAPAGGAAFNPYLSPAWAGLKIPG